MLCYPTFYAPPDTTDEKQASDMEVAMAAAFVAMLNGSDCIILDSMAVAQAATEDLDYQLLLAKMTTDDWHLH